MTGRRFIIGFALFIVLSGAAASNILLMQPQSTSQPKHKSNQVASAAATRPEPSAEVPRPEIRQAVVRELYTRGYLSGTEADLGPLVIESAILAFEHDHGLPLTAEANDRVLQGLILGTAGSATGETAAPGPTAKRVFDAIGLRLAKLGYPSSPSDLTGAIRRFERDYRLPETARVSAQLMQAINRASAVKGLATAG
ncbi:MAG: hypothetical protein K2Y05_05485 [Hyphomicrobiaceae bacterium]|nr:hypothetical protein [Hyphomicrobiaceae bacterium]